MYVNFNTASFSHVQVGRSLQPPIFGRGQADAYRPVATQPSQCAFVPAIVCVATLLRLRRHHGSNQCNASGRKVLVSLRAAEATIAAQSASNQSSKKTRRKTKHYGRRTHKFRHVDRVIPPLDPNPDDYEDQLDATLKDVQAVLQEHLGEVSLDVVRSSPLHHRHKMREKKLYRISDDSWAFRKLDPETRIPVPSFQDPYVSIKINDMMKRLIGALNGNPELRAGLIKTELLSNSAGEGLVCLSYAWPREDNWLERHIAPLLSTLQSSGVVIRAKNQRLVQGQDHLVQWYSVAGRRYPQILVENSFSQNNLDVCQKMLQWSVEQTASAGGKADGSDCGDLLELCCGNGNFTLPLCSNFRRVVAAEMDKVAVKNARLCAERADVQNLACVRMKVEEVVQALNRVREFRRLRDAGVDLDSMNFSTVLVNPPRSGLKPFELEAVSKFSRCIYVSCSPKKLARDLRKLPNHRVVSATVFDQFPFTGHAEVGVVLERRDDVAENDRGGVAAVVGAAGGAAAVAASDVAVAVAASDGAVAVAASDGAVAGGGGGAAASAASAAGQNRWWRRLWRWWKRRL